MYKALLRLRSNVFLSRSDRAQDKRDAISKTVYLSRHQIDEIGDQLENIYQKVMTNLGEAERSYIFRSLRIQCSLQIAGRTIIHFAKGRGKTVKSLLGCALLGTAKAINNMEIGHNVMHGQYDWMNEPLLDSHKFIWDHPCPPNQWRHSHNYVHHTFTNIRGKDKDLGYNTVRIDWQIPWRPYFLGNVLYNIFMMIFFDWGIMLHDSDDANFYLKDQRSQPHKTLREYVPFIKEWLQYAGKQVAKDYVLFPAIAGKRFWSVVKYNLIANTLRNIWTHAVIFCGHFPQQVRTFSEAETSNESRGEWYIRQMLGSCNISGSPLFHFMSGNLSYQIEHHLFPDMPSLRYKDVAPIVRQICRKYELPYNIGPFGAQLAKVWWIIVQRSLPDRFFAIPEQEQVTLERIPLLTAVGS